MNNTNRALNRFGIVLFGLVLLVAGAAAAAAASIPDWLGAWRSVSSSVSDTAAGVVADTSVDGSDRSWLLAPVAAVCLALIVLLVVFVFRQGRGHSRVLVSEPAARSHDEDVRGSVIIDGKVAEQAIQHALDDHPLLMSSSVSTFSVKRTPVLRITTNVRRGVSPRAVRSIVDDTVAAWDGVLGREIPVLVQINAGLAARVAKATRVGAGADTAVPTADPAPTTNR